MSRVDVDRLERIRVQMKREALQLDDLVRRASDPGMKKRIETIPAQAMKALQTYSWPGNIRELENFIERAVILSQENDLFVPLSELKSAPAMMMSAATNSLNATIEQAEREHILKALQESDWVIGGPTGAAARLGMKRTTLQSKIQKLGITRQK